MAKFTDEHKQEMGNYFNEGVHKVKITGVALGKTQGTEKEFMEFDVQGEQGQEASVRIWFTTDKAIKYSFNVVKSIFTHNAPEAKKDDARAFVDKIKDTEELEKACQALIGKEAWYSVFENPNRTYEKDGVTKNSFDRNISGWEPQVKKIEKTEPEPTVEGKNGEEPFGDF